MPRTTLFAAALAGLCVGGACYTVEEPQADTQPSAAESRAPVEVEDGPTETQIRIPDFAAVARAVGPSVVGVISTVEVEDGGRMHGIGSGMIISAHGEILTNEHVVRAAEGVKVVLADDSQVEADVIIADPLFDLAVLQLRGEFESLPPVRFRSPAQPPAPGEWIMAIGQPFGLGDTVTVGVVSGLGRDHADLGRPADLDPAGIWSFIQTDASINVGNSGGPLVDLDGRVVGITTAVRQDGQGLAFAIPSEMAMAFVDEVRVHRRMRHTRLGIDARNDNEHEGLPSVVRVTRVDEDGAGDRATLAVGDLILRVDGRPVSRVSEVAYLTQLAGVGAQVSLTVERGDDGRTESVTIFPEMAG